MLSCLKHEVADTGSQTASDHVCKSTTTCINDFLILNILYNCVNMTAFWCITLYSVVELDRRFRRAYGPTQRYIPGCHLPTRHPENLKFHCIITRLIVCISMIPGTPDRPADLGHIHYFLCHMHAVHYDTAMAAFKLIAFFDTCSLVIGVVHGRAKCRWHF